MVSQSMPPSAPMRHSPERQTVRMTSADGLTNGKFWCVSLQVFRITATLMDHNVACGGVVVDMKQQAVQGQNGHTLVRCARSARVESGLLYRACSSGHRRREKPSV